MHGHNPFAQFQTAGPMGQFPNQNPNFPKPQGNPQQGQFNPGQFPNPQMMQQFQTMQPQMFPNMMPNQMGLNNPGANMSNPQQQQTMPQPQKTRLIVKLENNERGFYSTMLAQVDPTDRGRVEGKDAATFFRRSGLPSDILKKIWLIATSDNKTLDKEEFYVYMRLVAYAQNNIEVSPQSIIQNIKAPLPKLNAVVPPPTQKKEAPSGESTPKLAETNLLDMGGPTVNTPNVQTNAQPNAQMNMQPNAQAGFGGFGNLGNPSMPNPQQNQQANLMGNMPNANMGFGGNIQNKPNMATTQNTMPATTQMNLLGDTPNLMGAQEDLLGGEPVQVTQPKPDLNIMPQTSSTGNLSVNQTSSPTNLKPETSLSIENTPASQGNLDDSQGFSDVLVDMTPEYIKQYETIYEQFDVNKKGIVTQQEIGDVFLRSGLGNDILFQIWSFCDTGDRGCLDKPEFMLSLHLIAMCKKKIRLPTTLPVKYEKFLKDAKKKLPGKDYLIEKARQALEDSSAPPRRSHQEDEYQQKPSDYNEGGYDNYENNQQYNEPVNNDYGASHHDGFERDDIPLTQTNYGQSTENTTQVLRKMQEHQTELMAAANQIRDSNNRAIAEKKEDIRTLNMILQACQDILQRLISENDYVQTEMVTLDNQKKNIQNSIESVQQQINQELVRQQGLHRNSRTGGGVSPNMMAQNRVSIGSPQKPHDEQFDADFQKEFAGGWDGFDNNFGDQNQNPNTANNFGDFNDF